MANFKIMVNWAEKKIIHTQERVGSEVYEGLKNNGYVKVGVVRPNPPNQILTTLPTDPTFFWDDKFFDPKAKYPSITKIQRKPK